VSTRAFQKLFAGNIGQLAILGPPVEGGVVAVESTGGTVEIAFGAVGGIPVGVPTTPQASMKNEIASNKCFLFIYLSKKVTVISKMTVTCISQNLLEGAQQFTASFKSAFAEFSDSQVDAVAASVE